MILVFILNASAGTNSSSPIAPQICELCAAANVDVRIVEASSGEEIRSAARDAIRDGADAVVAGGGDGTINTVATELAGSGIPLGILPLGTLNHFAKDLDIPLDMDAAVKVVLEGHTKRVDLGEVNGRPFLNNSSLGLYARIVRLRERHPARGLLKWFVAAWAMLKVLEKNPVLTLRIEAKEDSEVIRTPLLLVSNNAYRMAGLDAGSRDTLTAGRLSVYVVKGEGRMKLLRLALRIATGQEPDDQDLAVYEVTELTVESDNGHLWIARDGEVERMEGPYNYRIRPEVLKVLVPQA